MMLRAPVRGDFQAQGRRTDIRYPSPTAKTPPGSEPCHCPLKTEWHARTRTVPALHSEPGEPKLEFRSTLRLVARSQAPTVAGQFPQREVAKLYSEPAKQ